MDLRTLVGEGAPSVEVRALAYDTRQVLPGTLFFCVPGFTHDGHLFAPEAVARGAVALVVEHDLDLDLDVPQVRVPDVRAAMARAAAAFHGDPTSRLPVVGITGTNGKTTTAFLLRGLLEAAGTSTGLLGTVTTVVAGVEEPSVRTTPEAIDLQALFARMQAGGDRACVMEVSSHALQLRRADAIHMAVAVFTNLTQDHLDFHPDMESYFAAKRRLFELGPGVSVIDVDDPWGRRLLAERAAALDVRLDADGVPPAGSPLVTVAIDRPATLRAHNLAGDRLGTDVSVHGADGLRLDVRVPLPGRFNVRNALAAIAAARALGVPDDGLAGALAGAPRVPGRFEPVDAGQSFAVLVDYAHTPDSLENVLRAARELAEGRVVCVFGCGGDRDRGKRPIMGRIGSELADIAIVTSDNPRSEDPAAIIAEVASGAGPDAMRILDRREAIVRAVGLARAGDVVVIAGKGHEHGQELAGGVKVPFDDVAVAREALAERSTVSA